MCVCGQLRVVEGTVVQEVLAVSGAELGDVCFFSC